MLDNETKRKIDTARDILVGKVPDPKSQVEQITIALIYKFMDDMDKEAVEFGGDPTFFSGEFEKYSWTKIFDPKLGGHDMLNLYSEAILKLNQNPGIPQLFRDIFKNTSLPYRDSETLKLFLKTINEFQYDHSEKLGDAFEYLLSVLGSQGDAGQFRTPRHIIDFMVEIMQPKKNESICDPACGTAGFLISSYKHILESNTTKIKGDLLSHEDRKRLTNNFVGYDISPDMVRLSLANMYLHNFTSPRIYEYDTLTNEERWGEFFDIILANPPFMTPKGGIKPHKKFSMQANRSEVLFVDYIAEHINPTTGRAAIIVPEGIIFQGAGAYKSLRKLLIDKNYLYGVISLPPGVFQPYSGVKTSILLIDKSLAKKAENIIFVKIENDGFSLGAQRKELNISDIPDAISVLKDYKHKVYNNELASLDITNLPLNTLLVEKTRIKQNSDYLLSAERYRPEELKQHSRWEVIRLGDICDTSSGGTPSRNHPEYFENGSIPWIKSGEISKGYITASEEHITEEALQLSSAKLFPVDTVLVAMYGGTIGEVGILKIPACTNQAVCGILPGDKFIPEFLYLVLKARKTFLISQSSGGAQPNISQKIIRELNIPMPPLSVQREIVSKVEIHDSIINGAKQILSNYSPEIAIDPDWQTVYLGDVCLKMSNGVNFDSEQVGSGTKFVNIKDVFSEGYINTKSLDRVLLSDREIERNQLKDNDIIFVRSSVKYEGVGFPSLFKSTDSEPVVFCGFLIKATLNLEMVAPAYLLYLLRTSEYRRKVVALSNRSSITNISQDNLKSLIIPLPTLKEQEKIVKEIEYELSLIKPASEIIKTFTSKIEAIIENLWIK